VLFINTGTNFGSGSGVKKTGTDYPHYDIPEIPDVPEILQPAEPGFTYPPPPTPYYDQLGS